MDTTLESDGVRLAHHVARPTGVDATRALVLCHGFPAGEAADRIGQTYPELAEALAAESGWIVVVFNFRGTGASGGSFSPAGWLADVHAAVAMTRSLPEVEEVWLAGSSTGGSLAICAAATDSEVLGVATLAAPASFDGWAEDPARLLEHSRSIGLVADDEPVDLDRWSQELGEGRAVELVTKLAPRPLLVLHGTVDETVPTSEAVTLAEAYGPAAELHLVKGAGHRLRHDPRARAVLTGWLVRQSA